MKRNFHINTSIGYQFFESPAISDSCFPVYRKELWHGIIKVLLLCKVCDFDTPLWTANQCKDFLVFISICMPVSSKDNVCVLSFCPALILPFRIFPLFYTFFYIWHWMWDIVTWLSVTFVHDTHLRKFLQINTVVQYDRYISCSLTYTCTHTCLPALCDS